MAGPSDSTRPANSSSRPPTIGGGGQGGGVYARLAARARHWWDTEIAVLPTTYWTIWLGTLIDRLGCFVVPFLALYLTRERGLTAAQAGLVVSLQGAGGIGAGLIGGALADRIGRKPTATAGLVLGAASIVGLAFADSVRSTAVLTFCSGLCYGINRPAITAMIADVVPPRYREQAYNHLYWAINLGISVSLLAAGLLAHFSLRLLFLGDAIATVLFVLLLVTRVRETRPVLGALGHPRGTRQEQTTNSLHSVAIDIREVASDSVFMPFAGLNLLVGCIFSQWSLGLPLDMQAHGLPPSYFGPLVAINGLMIILLQPFAPRVLRRLRRSRGLVISALCIGTGFGLHAVGHSVPAYALAISVWTIGEILTAPLGVTLVAELAPLRLRALYQGFFSTAWNISSFAGPILGGYVMDRWGASTLWSGAFVLGWMVALGYIATAPARRSRLGSLHEQVSPMPSEGSITASVGRIGTG